jgi:hypothetical protein
MIKVDSESNPVYELNLTEQLNLMFSEIRFLKRDAINVIDVYRRFGGTWCLHPHLSLKIEAARSSETSGKYRKTWHHTPEIIIFIVTALRTPIFFYYRNLRKSC